MPVILAPVLKMGGAGDPARLGRRPAEYVFSVLAAPVAQTCSLSVSPEIVAAREAFFNHGWTRINTDEDRLSLIRVHPCSSVVGTYWLRLCRAVLYRRVALCQTLRNHGAWDRSDALPITNRRYGRLKICATVNTYARQPPPLLKYVQPPKRPDKKTSWQSGRITMIPFVQQANNKRIMN